MNNSVLDITALEKRKLRYHKIRLDSIHQVNQKDLMVILSIPKIRAMELSALSEFQSLPSIGPAFAHDLISMGFYNLKELKSKDGAKLTDTYEKQIGVWSDPCVEDQFRLIVHYANHRDIHKNWWDFSVERKAFRASNGYPASRPRKPWFELARHNRTDRVMAARKQTKADLARRLNASIQYMKNHYSVMVTLPRLADTAAMSVYYFLRQFKNVYEVTPLQYLTRLRLKNASRLLKSTKRSIGVVCRQCGFENESSFIRLFKKEIGSTPLQFRKQKLQL